MAKFQVGDHLVSIEYMLSSVMDMIRERIHTYRLNIGASELKYEKKKLFGRMIFGMRVASLAYEELMMDKWNVVKSAKHFEELQCEESMVLKMILYYYDRFSTNPRHQAELMDFLKTHGESQGFLSEEIIESFTTQA